MGLGQLHVLPGALRAGDQRQRQHLHPQRHRRGPVHCCDSPVQSRMFQKVGGHYHQRYLGRRDWSSDSSAEILLGGIYSRWQPTGALVHHTSAGVLVKLLTLLFNAACVCSVPASSGDHYLLLLPDCLAYLGIQTARRSRDHRGCQGKEQEKGKSSLYA